MAVKCQCGALASLMAGCLSDRKGGEVQCEGLHACPACSHVDILPPKSLLNPPGFWILARKVEKKGQRSPANICQHHLLQIGHAALVH